MDIAKDPDYANIYDKLPNDSLGNSETRDEMRFFMSNVEDVSMQMTLFQVRQMLFTIFEVDCAGLKKFFSELVFRHTTVVSTGWRLALIWLVYQAQ